jgi:hypothetical protein
MEKIAEWGASLFVATIHQILLDWSNQGEWVGGGGVEESDIHGTFGSTIFWSHVSKHVCFLCCTSLIMDMFGFESCSTRMRSILLLLLFYRSGLGTCLLAEPQDHNFKFPEMPLGVVYDREWQCNDRFGPTKPCDPGPVRMTSVHNIPVFHLVCRFVFPNSLFLFLFWEANYRTQQRIFCSYKYCASKYKHFWLWNEYPRYFLRLSCTVSLLYAQGDFPN